MSDNTEKVLRDMAKSLEEDPRDLAIRDMAEALRFYADRENHRDVGEIGLNNIFADGGNKADTALSKHAAQIKQAEGE